MKIFLGIILLLCFMTTASRAQWKQAPYAADGSYQGIAPLGDIAEWKFNGGADLSGKGHTLTLRGADSRFENGALVIEEKKEIGDKRAGAVTPNNPDLTPAGAFTLEVWFSPAADFFQKDVSFLVDKKYFHGATTNPRSNFDYLLLLRKKGEKFMLDARLGFGKDTSVAQSSPQTLEAGKTYHAVFSYDGAGKSQFFLNGVNIGQTEWQGRGAVAAGPFDLTIGDRFGSTGYRFLGRIFRVRLSSVALNFVSGKVLLDPQSGRTAFMRMEEGAALRVKITNDTAANLQNAQLEFALPGTSGTTRAIPALPAGKSTFVDIPIDTRLHPARYEGVLTLRNAAVNETVPAPVTIVPRPLPHQMPVVMWGTADNDQLQELKDIGFTHQLVYPSNGLWDWVWNHGADGELPVEGEREQLQLLDKMFAMQLGGVAYVAPGRWAGDYQKEYRRVDRNGNPYPRANIDGLFPRIQKFVTDAGKTVAKIYGNEPGLQGALLHTEVRDGTQLSFHDIDKKAWRDFSGGEIPQGDFNPRNYGEKLYQEIRDFPANHIVPDDYPLLKYLRWFWQKGDGWNTLNTLTNDALKTAGNGRIWTFSDPAVRAPAVYGNNGDVDYLSQWTYTYPDPMKIGLAEDELFAMAAGRPGQQVMNMTQIIWYRSQTTGKPIAGQETSWEKAAPDAKFISIAPDHLSEALWIELTRPVQRIAYHGWGSLGDKTGEYQGSYVTTNPETRKRLQSLLHDVVQPLAPVLLQIPDRKTDVAFLESFSSQMLAGRGTYGWGNGWGADSYLIANYAGLEPDIVYAETINQKGLNGYKVLFLMHCDVLTQSVADKIKEFQRNGGIVIGDEFLAPGIQPDILLTSVKRGAPDKTKLLYLQKAAELSRELNDFYEPPLQSSNPEVFARSRTYKNAAYIFTINDHRTYGDYVGQYKMVMEKGLPAQSEITLQRGSGFVYDLMNCHEIKTRQAGNKLQFTTSLSGGAGNLFLVTDKPVGALQMAVPAMAQRGKSTFITAQLNDSEGQPLQAVIPLEVTISDPQNRIAEKSGYYGAAGGKLSLQLDVAPNDAPGQWEIEVSERLTGQRILRSFLVK
jgi:hypothetical protein